MGQDLPKDITHKIFGDEDEMEQKMEVEKLSKQVKGKADKGKKLKKAMDKIKKEKVVKEKAGLKEKEKELGLKDGIEKGKGLNEATILSPRAPAIVTPSIMGSPMTATNSVLTHLNPRRSWADEVEAVKPSPMCAQVLMRNEDVSGNRDSSKGLQLSYCDLEGGELVISLDDVKEEREYWKNSLIVFVLGEKTPFRTMESFIRG
ncbi:hypothetical protein Droror1_Dr00008081 [Drosera rotundifolia]